MLVNDLLMDYFVDILDYGFTSNMEKDLDEIANGELEWTKVIGDFYKTFEPDLKKAQAEMPETKAELEKVGKPCPECGSDLVIRWGRYGKFVSCSNFPACRHTEAFLEKIGVQCPEDQGDIVLRKTRKNRIFYGCANYPECTFTSWKRPVAAPCPKCGGLLVIANKREVQCMKCEEMFLVESIPELASEGA
jgi:DNA topoisomerase-1